MSSAPSSGQSVGSGCGQDPKPAEAHRAAAIGACDAHVHVFVRGAELRALAPDRRYTPCRDAPLADLLALTAGHGISRAVLVQPSFLGTDNSQLLSALAMAPERLRGVAVVEETAPTHTLAAMRNAGVAGHRLNLIGRPAPDLGQPGARAFLERLRIAGWHVEVQVEGARLSAVLPPLLAAGLPVVVDHFGLPGHPFDAGDATWRALAAAAQDGDVFVKLSGGYRFGATDLRPYVHHLLELLGAERLLWGSDWPWTRFEEGRSYRAALHEVLDAVAAGDRAAILRTTPARLYGFDGGGLAAC